MEKKIEKKIEKKMRGSTSKNTNRSEQPSPPKIVVAIKSQDGDTTYYRVEPEKKVRALLALYCKKKDFKRREVIFLHDNARVQPNKTFTENGIKDADEIDAMVHQTGGGCSST